MSSIYVAVLLSFFVLTENRLVLPPDLQEYADELHDICIKRTGITEDDHLAYDIINNPHDEKLQCYIKCLLLEANWMKSDGVIQYDWIEKNIHEGVKDIVLAALSKCRVIEDGRESGEKLALVQSTTVKIWYYLHIPGRKGANLCEKASHFNACMFKADSDNWYLV